MLIALTVMLTVVFPPLLAGVDGAAVGEDGGGEVLVPMEMCPGLDGSRGVESLLPSEKAGTQKGVLWAAGGRTTGHTGAPELIDT